MDISILSTFELVYHLRPQWEELHRTANGTVFQSYEWVSEWWNIFHQHHQLFIITAWQGANLVGLFPAYRQEYRIGPLTFKRLRFLGEGTTPGEYQPLVLPEYENDLYARAASLCAQELSEQRCGAVDFQHVRLGSTFSRLFTPALQAQGLTVHTHSPATSRIIIELPDTFEGYLRAIPQKQRKQLKRQSRILRENGATLHVTTQPTEFPSVFEHLVRLHEGVWEQRGTFGRFTGTAGLEPFLRRVVPPLMAKGQAKIYSLLAGDKCIASRLLFFSPGFACGFIHGWDPHHPLSKFSPGTTLFSMCIEDVIGERCLIFDFLGGKQPHKLRLGGQLTSYARIVALASGINGLKARAIYSGTSIRRALRRHRN